MSTIRPIPPCNLTYHNVRWKRSFALSWIQNPVVLSSHFFNSNQILRSRGHGRNITVVRSSVDPGPPDPSSPGSCDLHGRKMWILGVAISVIFPFWKGTWGPLLNLKNKLDTVVEVAEEATEVVEKVAEEVEKAAEEVADHLPEGGKLKAAATSIEKIAKETAKDAHLVEDIIEKVEDVEEEVVKDVESFVPLTTGNPSEESPKVAENNPTTNVNVAQDTPTTNAD